MLVKVVVNVVAVVVVVVVVGSSVCGRASCDGGCGWFLCLWSF